MPLKFFVGDETNEQSLGPVLNSGRVQLYAARREDPLNLIYLGGHRIDDAPDYTNTEAKISPEYRHEAGRNIVVEKTIVPESVKQIEWTLALPNRVLNAADRLAQAQASSEYDYFFIPSSCDDGCDEWFWLAEEGVLGARQITSAPVGFDENEGPITSTRTLRTKGQVRTYLGMEQRLVRDHTKALYAITIAEELCSDGDACPFQHQYAGGADMTLIGTHDKWGTVVSIDASAVNEAGEMDPDDVITSVLYHNNVLIVAVSDVVDGDGTEGGAGYSVNDAPVVPSTFLNANGSAATPKGMQVVLPGPGGRVYIFGTSGEGYYSENNGITFHALTTGITTTIIDAAYDSVNGYMYLVTEDGEVWRYDGSAFVEITAAVSPTAATDLVCVNITGINSIAIGGADGNIYESFDGGATWQQTYDLGASPVHAIMGSTVGAYRVVAGAGTSLFQRDVFRRQEWEAVAAATADQFTGDVMGGAAGKPLAEEGNAYYVFVTDDGEIVELSHCKLCL